jgi:hypothetical protein
MVIPLAILGAEPVLLYAESFCKIGGEGDNR